MFSSNVHRDCSHPVAYLLLLKFVSDLFLARFSSMVRAVVIKVYSEWFFPFLLYCSKPFQLQSFIGCHRRYSHVNSTLSFLAPLCGSKEFLSRFGQVIRFNPERLSFIFSPQSKHPISGLLCQGYWGFMHNTQKWCIHSFFFKFQSIIT